MPNKEKKSLKKAKKQFPKSNYSPIDEQTASEGLELINDFFSWFTPDQAKDELWDLFLNSLNSPGRDAITNATMANITHFAEQLKQLIKGSAMIVGVK